VSKASAWMADSGEPTAVANLIRAE
jgi:hypothetical protein